jgi:hypothetical protein
MMRIDEEECLKDSKDSWSFASVCRCGENQDRSEQDGKQILSQVPKNVMPAGDPAASYLRRIYQDTCFLACDGGLDTHVSSCQEE